MVQSSSHLTILEKDRQFTSELPKYTVVSASAGSGKTRALKQRVLQLLLSRSIPNNALKNILAITFTNNAAREMKQRVLDGLKSASLGNQDTLKELGELLSLAPSDIQLGAKRLVDEILDNYSDFQIRTIDSFLARVFKASALELGLSPDLDIALDSAAILDEAFSLFARELRSGTRSAALVDQLIVLLLESRGGSDRFFWNPYPELADKVKELYSRIILTSKTLRREDHTEAIAALAVRLINAVLTLDATISSPKLAKAKRFLQYVEYAKAHAVDGLTTHKFPSPPITKKESDPKEYQNALAAIQPLCEEIEAVRAELILLQARQHYQPYAEAHALLSQSIEAVKHERGQVDIGDVVKRLAQYLKPGIVPEVYYSLGETLCHYLIDEFQDTNPIQWETLEPLVGNALATKGSLFVVGDTKQSIYGFRGADWRIMRRLQTEDVFPSAKKDLKVLETNYRSHERILSFNNEVFKTIVPQKVGTEAASASGLATDRQFVRESFEGKGYVEVISIAPEVASPEADPAPQKTAVLAVVSDCLNRGYRRSDITILTPRNNDVIELSGWLNERGLAFISHSSLDVRSRTVTGEILALLRFLDSPIDDLSFATFLLGTIFNGMLQRDGKALLRTDMLDLLFLHRTAHRHEQPFYITFRNAFPDMWSMYFEELFNVVGYLPVYDLLSETFVSFSVFSLIPSEEATFAKMLEVVKDFEEKGENNLKGFLEFAGTSSEDANWNIDIPTDIDAIRVMTVHKAKGLESKVVIVLLYDSSSRSSGPDFEEEEDEIRLVHLTADNSENVPALADLYRQKRLRATVDDLNKLYVSLSRAEEEMYIVSIQAKNAKTPSMYLPEVGYGPGVKPRVESEPAQEEVSVVLNHDLPRTSMRPTEFSSIAAAEARRGEFAHAILEALEYADADLPSQLNAATDRALKRIPYQADPAPLQHALMRMLSHDDVRPFFERKPGRRVLNEQEFTESDGQLFRMDRVVVDAEIVTVLDYKTGEEKPDYKEQVLKYMKILRGVYPDRAVRGLLLYVDQNITRPVS